MRQEITNLLHWWRTLKQNPIYQRERGHWGSNPNHIYSTLMRFSPFVVLGALVLGACGAFSNFSAIAGNSGSAAFGFYCLICLPNIAMNVVTLYGAVMAPALTAPSISQEQVKGTWDMLLVTPQSNYSIIGAKLLGALARLRIWSLLLLLSLLQGCLSVFITFSALYGNAWLGLLMVPATVVRPFLDVVLAALLGLYLSTWIRTATTALALTYSILMGFRLFNSSVFWAFITGGLLGFNDEYLLFTITLLPVLGLLIGCGVMLGLLVARAEKLGSLA